MNSSTIHTSDTVFSADSVEWCPYSGYECVFALGTYQVQNSGELESFSASQRSGTIILHKQSHEKLEHLQTLKGSAVLDMKWAPPQSTFNSGSSPNKDIPKLAVVDAKGMLTIYELLEEKDSRPYLKQSICTSICNSAGEENSAFDILALSLDWNSRKYSPPDGLEIVVSSSKGALSTFKVNDKHLERNWHRDNCHDYEAWIAAFDAWNFNVIYSGGDDGALKVFDTRCTNSCVSSIRRPFSAGVTSLLSDVYREHKLYSGSYDENMHSWDTRKMKQPLSTLGMGGGIWRIRQMAFQNEISTSCSNLLATACMHGGFNLVDVDKFETVINYAEHESLAYGIDFKSIRNFDDVILASCSFYDHALKIWKVSWEQ